MPPTLLLLLMATAATSPPSPSIVARATPVEIAIAAAVPDAFEAVRADLRELLARLDVEARYRTIAAVDRAEVLRPPAEAPCALACVWLDLGVSAPGLAIVYISATASEQVVIRRMPLAAGIDEVAREEVAHIVASSIEALRAGRPLPVGGAGAGSNVAVVSTAAAPPPAPAPPPSTAMTWLLGVGAGAARESAGHVALPTLGLSLLVAADDRARALTPALWLQADGSSSTLSGAPVGLRLRGGDLAALVALAAHPRARVVARVGLGLGAELVDMTPSLDDATAPGVRLGASRLQPAAFARAATRLEVRAWERVGVFVAAACDARFVVNRYTIDRDGTTQVLFEPQRLRPWAFVGVDAVLGQGARP